MWRIALVVSLGCAGCPSPEPEEPSCAEIAAQFEAKVASVDRSCSEPSDCTVAGGPTYIACDGQGHLPAHGVRAAAYSGTEAWLLEANFVNKGCETDSTCEPRNASDIGSCHLMVGEGQKGA